MAIGGETLPRQWGASYIAVGLRAAGDNISYCSFGHCQAVITVVIASGRDVLLVRPVESYEDDAALVFDVQSYLWCKAVRCPVPPCLQRAWDIFYGRYQPLVRRSIQTYCRHAAFAAQLDDFSQEVWREIVVALPKLAYDSRHGDLRAWLTVLARRKTRRQMRRVALFSGKRRTPIEIVEKTVSSRDLRPEDLCHLREIRDQLKAFLVQLRGRTVPRNYEVFCRRFFDHQRVSDVAAALGLTPKAVQRRYDRVLREWRSLVKDFSVVSECGR
jgi:RNA polymerase sigma factor (sigma-70 family)